MIEPMVEVFLTPRDFTRLRAGNDARALRLVPNNEAILDPIDGLLYPYTRIMIPLSWVTSTSGGVEVWLRMPGHYKRWIVRGETDLL